MTILSPSVPPGYIAENPASVASMPSITPALTRNAGNEIVARRPSDLLPIEQVQQWSKRSDAMGLSYFIGHYALFGLSGWLSWMAIGTYWFIPAFLTQAFIVGFLFSPTHEMAHGTAFATRWLNESAYWITCMPYTMLPYWFRYYHLGHHRYTQVKGKDPTLVLPSPASIWQYLWNCSSIPFFIRNWQRVVLHTSGRFIEADLEHIPKGRQALLVLEARIFIAFYITLFAAAAMTGYLDMLLVVWLLPRLVGEPIQRMMRVAEHVGCEEGPDLLTNTRTTYSNAVFKALAWQMPYHAEHHLFPNTPFFALPKVHALVRDRVVVESRGYIAGQIAVVRMLLRGESRC